MELLYKASNMEICYDSIHRFLYCNWIGYQSHAELVHSGFIMLELLKQKRVHKILNDNSKVEGAWIDSSEWTAQRWFPNMANAGLQHFSWILSTDVFAEFSALKAQPTISTVKIEFFDSGNNSFNDALTWLQKYADS
jgi:hypothetical protein